MRVLLALALAPTASSCATIYTWVAGKPEVRVTSEPDGAIIRFADGSTCKAPCSHTFEVAKEQKVEAALPDGRAKKQTIYRRLQYAVFGNVLFGFLVGALFVGIDYFDDDMWTVLDDDMRFDFTPAKDDEDDEDEDEAPATNEDEDDDDDATAPPGASVTVPPAVAPGAAVPAAPAVSPKGRERERPLVDSPSVRRLREQFPETYVDGQIRAYYGGLPASQLARVRTRLYHILLEIEAEGDAPDLDEAVRRDRFDEVERAQAK